jgi:hypothetical protein
MRLQDVPVDDGLDELHVELTTRRLGMSHTVAREIDRYRGLAERNQRVDRESAIALLQLAGRRTDASLLFADAGRLAAELAVRRVGAVRRGTWTTLPGFVRRRAGLRLARRLARDIFDVDLRRDGSRLEVQASGTVFVEATPDGSACRLVGSATATLLRTLLDFEGAVQHESCQASGGPECRWLTTESQGNAE